MPACTACRGKLLDHLYGLLDPAESAAVEAHLAACPACAAFAAKSHGWLAAAAKSAFPEVSFRQPTSGTTRPVAAATPAPVAAKWSWVPVALAASILLLVAGWAILAAFDTAGYALNRGKVDRQLAELRRIEAEKEQLEKKIDADKKAADDQLAAANAEFKAIEERWIKVEKETAERLNKLPFMLDVRGPATALAGAPNEYTIRVTDAGGNGLADPVTVEATLKDSNENELLTEKFTTDPANGHKLKVPAGVWSKVSAGADVFLSVTATDKAGAKSELTENLKLLQPVYTTFLATDKPMYRPGETVYFRTLTLDRTRFLPPDRDVQLRFEIKAKSGQVLQGSTITGLARAGTLNPAETKVEPVLGPDGKPVRGVGTAAFTLPVELAGGEYTLNAYEVPTPAGEKITADPTNLLASRTFIVNKYTADKLEKKLEFDGKSYGPGDVVQAKLSVKQIGQPVVAKLSDLKVTVDGKVLDKFDVEPVGTNPDGFANIKFTLPKDAEEFRDASIGIGVTVGGITETLVRPIPLTSRKPTVEFFPEGGDLIAGVPNRVYFRVTTSKGKPADAVGTLMLGGKEVTAVNAVRTLTDPDHPGANQGMGVFEFTPEADKLYSLKLSKPLGLIQPEGGFPLLDAKGAPLMATKEAKENRVLLRVPTGVTRPGEPIKVQVTSVVKKRDVLVGAYVRGRSVAHATLSLEPGKAAEASLNLDESKLGGVTRVTVFDLPNKADVGREDLQPLAERLVFRAPAEELKVSFTARRSGGKPPTGAFVPGERVDLDIESKDENDKAKPAVLWAAVVNQSVITMADEKTERLLPTHFLLSGEVQKGDELEHADFLLTKHPKAAEALDLLLGTQGWRRFAEQKPELFRQQVPAEEANRILLVSAAAGDIPTGWQPAMRKVFNDYYPQFESALLGVERAEKGKAETYRRSGNDEVDLAKTRAEYDAELREFAKTSEQIRPFDDSWQQRRKHLGLVIAGLLGLAGVSVAVGRGLFRGTAAGTTLVVTAVALLGAAGLVGGFALLTGQNNDDWRETAQVAHAKYPDVRKEVEKARAAGGAAMPMDGAPYANLAAGKDMATEKADEKMPKAVEKEKFDRMAEAKKDGGGQPGGGGGFGGGQRPGGGPPPGFGQGGPPAGGFPPQAMRPEGPVPQPPGVPAGPAKPVAPPAPGGVVGGFPGGPMPAEQLQFPGGGLPEDFEPGRGKGAFGNGPADRLMAIRGVRGGGRVNEFIRTRQKELGEVIGKAGDAKKQQQAAQQIALFDVFLPQAQPLVVREYAHKHAEVTDPNAPREDFTETLLWQPVVVTPQSGKATVSFSLSDDVAPYRVLVAGHSLDGRIGAVSGVIEVRKPFALDPKLPQEIGSADKLDVPLVGLNGTEGTRTADVTVTPTGLKVDGSDRVQLALNGTAGGRKLVRLLPDKLDGDLAVRLDGKAGADTDSVTRKLTVVPDGFPASGQKSDVLEQKLAATFGLPKQVVPGTLKMKVTVYPNTLSEVQSGLDGLLREPNGCFEQTSTTNYPNVLILDYLNETNQAKPEVSKRAKELLDRGYGRLTSFECQKGDGREGYEWFGGTAPPHEALTAYGLLQFTDMSRVFPVDKEMLKRTKQYLIDARDGKGGFKKNARALDTFGYAPAEIANAYIVWSITEAERTAENKSDLATEVESLTKMAKEGDWAKDPYFVGLVANCLLNRGDRKGGEELLKALADKQDKKDGRLTGAKASVTNSTGMALEIETTALAVLGWLKANEAGTYRANVEAACKWIGGQRQSGGAFGSTQSTILALKALIEYARSNKRPAENGTVVVKVNGTKVGEKAFTTEQSGPIVVEIEKPEELFKDGKVDIEVGTDAKQAYPCTVSWECRTRQPDSSPECPIKLGTKLSKTEVTEGETVRLEVTVKNLKDRQDGMVTAIVGIPAGLKVPEDMKQLKLLTTPEKDGKRATVSYWEKRGRELVFYWHGLEKDQEVKFGVDLIADVPGEYRGPASRAYLYYGAEHKHWVEPVDVKISGK